MIIGAAFGKIVDSLVKQILMPLISLVTPGQHGYLHWKWVVRGREILYGQFLGELLNFLVVAFALFLFVVKFLGWITREKAQKDVPPTTEENLLMEIRDLLKEGHQRPPS